jgi:hypothetical protein
VSGSLIAVPHNTLTHIPFDTLDFVWGPGITAALNTTPTFSISCRGPTSSGGVTTPGTIILIFGGIGWDIQATPGGPLLDDCYFNEAKITLSGNSSSLYSSISDFTGGLFNALVPGAGGEYFQQVITYYVAGTVETVGVTLNARQASQTGQTHYTDLHRLFVLVFNPAPPTTTGALLDSSGRVITDSSGNALLDR